MSTINLSLRKLLIFVIEYEPFFIFVIYPGQQQRFVGFFVVVFFLMSTLLILIVLTMFGSVRHCMPINTGAKSLKRGFNLIKC